VKVLLPVRGFTDGAGETTPLKSSGIFGASRAPGARRRADIVRGHDAEHERTGRIAGAVDGEPLMAIADARVFGLVLLDIAAVIRGDVQVGTRRSPDTRGIAGREA
jgi:hypothetical protein